ncbi:MAG: Ig-like domain-containing protein [Sideroxydans sp.]|nr:Ig-like domain-containing protein [Sideroxydans sp.]
MQLTHVKRMQLFFASALLLTLVGCGGREIPATTATPVVATSTASSISLRATGTQVKSDGSDSVVITATALDSKNALVTGQVLNIASSGGQLSASTVTTDTTGKATFTFSGGTSGMNNTITVTVTASGSSVSQSLPINIAGSSITLTSAGSANSSAAGTPISIGISAKNAGGLGVASQSLRYSIAPSSTGSGTLNTTLGTTNTAGAASVSLTGTAAGNVDVTVEWLNAAGTVTATSVKTITITSTAGVFQVTTPAASPASASIGTNQAVTVQVPATIGTTTVAALRYATSLGSWLANGRKVFTTTGPLATTNTQTFVPGNSAGNATVQIDALDASGNVLTTASLALAISAPTPSAAAVTLQSGVSVLRPSVGTTLSTTTFTAVVRDAAINANGQPAPNPVGGANVLFELIGSTGSGETLSPIVATTNANGQAVTTYTAGALPTTQGAGVKASLIDNPSIFSIAPITVGGQATSVSLGTSTALAVNPENTSYTLPITVLVSDSSGAAVSGAVVSLSLWPVGYYEGIRDAACKAQLSAYHPNEDLNSNLILDAGEDIDGPFRAPDNMLWPAPSAAGSIPQSVITGVDGTATFTWTYLKQYADWVDARIKATLQVQGSQTSAEIPLHLLPVATDIKTPCPLPNSLYN